MLPEAAEPSTLVEDELLLGLVEPDEDVEPCGQAQFSAGLLVLDEVPPEVLDWSVVDELVLPLALVEPEALPVPEDWLVCAPWFMVEDGLVVVALWLAVAPLEELWLPEPMFTSGLTFAPAFTSVLLMPTLASTPTFGFTLVEELEVELLGCEVEDDWAKAGAKAPITAAAVMLTAKFMSLMLSLLG